MAVQSPGDTSSSRSNVIKMKMILPVGKERAWRLLTTRRGISSWFCATCIGKIAVGETLEFGWPGEVSVNYRVIYLGPKHSSFRLQRADGLKMRVYLHGRLTTLTLELEYPKPETRRDKEALQAAGWAFFLANLKSVALNGPDLRNNLHGRTWSKGFID